MQGQELEQMKFTLALHIALVAAAIGTVDTFHGECIHCYCRETPAQRADCYRPIRLQLGSRSSLSTPPAFSTTLAQLHTP